MPFHNLASWISRLVERPSRLAFRGGNHEHFRSSSGLLVAARVVVALVALAWLVVGATPALALKVATWNATLYPASDLAGRQTYFRQVLAALDPDVIALQELTAAAGRDSFLTNVLNVVQPGQWSATSYFATCESAVFYKTAKVTFLGGVAVPTAGPRDVLGVRLRLVGYASKLAEFRLYSVHFKAGETAADSTTRRLECADLRNNMNAATSLGDAQLPGLRGHELLRGLGGRISPAHREPGRQ
jgi:hypothetical protein